MVSVDNASGRLRYEHVNRSDLKVWKLPSIGAGSCSPPFWPINRSAALDPRSVQELTNIKDGLVLFPIIRPVN